MNGRAKLNLIPVRFVFAIFAYNFAPFAVKGLDRKVRKEISPGTRRKSEASSTRRRPGNFQELQRRTGWERSAFFGIPIKTLQTCEAVGVERIVNTVS
jgi:hypothetical protein